MPLRYSFFRFFIKFALIFCRFTAFLLIYTLLTVAVIRTKTYKKIFRCFLPVFLYLFGRLREDLYAFIGHIFLFRQPFSKLGLGNNVHFAFVLLTLCGTIIMPANGGSVIAQHVGRHDVRNHIYFDIVVVAHLAFGKTVVINVPLNEYAVFLESSYFSLKKFSHFIVKALSDVIDVSLLLPRQKRKHPNAKPSLFRITDFHRNNLFHLAAHPLFRLTHP